MELKDIPNVTYFPHPEAHSGELKLDKGYIYISPSATIDLTGTVEIGENSMIGHETKIFTHDHYHDGLEPLLERQTKMGVKWCDKRIGKDVWLHGCIVLAQVTDIPDGVVVGAGAVLTKNPQSYGIYGGNPARLIRYRTNKDGDTEKKEWETKISYLCSNKNGRTNRD
jgi:maltose O-acetyltransferase